MTMNTIFVLNAVLISFIIFSFAMIIASAQDKKAKDLSTIHFADATNVKYDCSMNDERNLSVCCSIMNPKQSQLTASNSTVVRNSLNSELLIMNKRNRRTETCTTTRVYNRSDYEIR